MSDDGHDDSVSPILEVGSKPVNKKTRGDNLESTQWRMMFERQNEQILALIQAVTLPEFDPDKRDADPQSWCATADLCLADKPLYGSQLIVALIKALKGTASTWLSQVTYAGITWPQFKELFRAWFLTMETIPATLLHLNTSRPNDGESYATYASRLISSLMNRWKNVSIEQIAVSVVLAHFAQIDTRLQRLAFTTEISSRQNLHKELQAYSYLKRKVPHAVDDTSDNAKQARMSTITMKCCIRGKPGKHGDAKSTTANGKDEDGPADDAKDEKGAKAEDIKKVSEEDEEGQDSGGAGEEGDDEDDNEEGDEENEEEKDEALKPKPKEDPPMILPTTKVLALGHISNVEVSLSRFKTQDQKILHQYLYGQLCPDRNVTDNIKNFQGFQWAIHSTEYKAKLMETARMEPRHLRAMCEMLDLENHGGPSELATRLMGFLQQLGAAYSEISLRPPVKKVDRGAAFAQGPRRTRSHSPPSVTHRDEEDDSEKDTKVNDSKEDSEDSDSTTKTSSEASDAASEVEDFIGTEGREAEAKIIPDRQINSPKNKKNARDMRVRSTKGEKASSEESYESEKSSEDEEEEESDEEESGEESDSPADKKAKRPPTDEDIKKYVKRMLHGANLEKITMKTVCKQVYNHYPDFDLEHKKDFIKSAVKSLL